MIKRNLMRAMRWAILVSIVIILLPFIFVGALWVFLQVGIFIAVLGVISVGWAFIRWIVK